MNARREQLLSWYALDERVAELADALEATPADPALDAEFERTRQAASELWDAYFDGLSPLPVSRCPFTGQVLDWSIDVEGLDGPWWDRDAPARPYERLLPSVHSLAGAVRLGSLADAAPFVCAPGPERPWVAPAVLQQPGVRAVVSALPIGPHQGYLIAYFIEPGCHACASLPDWGIDHQRRRDNLDETRYRVPDPADAMPDFELTAWIAAGKLLWIDPGDDGLRLHAGLAGCPFLELEGRCEPALLMQGRLWVGGRILEETPT
jgi:hypothetical protein